MRFIAILSILVSTLIFTSCETLKQTSNTTGAVFSLNGQWELVSNSPENTLIGSRITVAPFVSEARFTTLVNNSQCYRENDIKWKNIASNSNGGFLLNNLLSNCNGTSLNYQPATLTVINTNEIQLAGRNVGGMDNTQTWRRIAK